MGSIVLKNLMEIMQAMINLEIELSRFYGAVAEMWPEDANFWKGIQEEEVGHARNLKALFEKIKKTPNEFSYGRSFNITAINTIKSHIKAMSANVKSGEIKKDRIFLVARDLERSLMEANYVEVVQTRNVEFNQMVAEIHRQTIEHEQRIKDKIMAAKK